MTKRGRKHGSPLRVVIAVLLGVIVVATALWLLIQGKDIAVLNPQGVVASQQKDLMLFTLLLSAIVVVPVFTMIFAFAWRYREGNHKAKFTPDVDGNKWVEFIWWTIPILIIGVLSVVTWVSTHQLDPYKPLASDEKPLKVQVLALQWKWLFIYPEQGVATVNDLKIPAGTPVNFEISADGPMSGFWIPSLGTQTYAMNGMTAKLSLMADKAGEYIGSNSNITGKGYADMYFTAEALPSRGDFFVWVDSVVNDDSHAHMDSGIYEELAKPGVMKKPQSYHLHDPNLYDKVVNKYADGKHTMGEKISPEYNEQNHYRGSH